MPLLVKDAVAHTAGDPYHCGMRLLKDRAWTEPNDSFLVERFRRAEPLDVEAPRGTFTIPSDFTGQPAVSLPLHWNDEGLPIAIQLVAPAWREDLLIRVAAQLETARPWGNRRPLVHA